MMALDSTKLLDEVGWQILQALQQEARLSYAELGRRVGLSLPAVAERVRRLEEAGIITGYQAQINAQKVGLTIPAFVRISVRGEQYPAFTALMRSLPEVLECHHLSGGDSFMLRVVTVSIPHLEKLIARLSSYGPTTTSIILSSPVTGRAIEKNLAEAEG
jgi:Lrp/AsnC family leucine-responsive transcriptional regulator